MKVLQSCRENFAHFGLNPPSLGHPRINKRNSMVISVLISNAVLANVFFFKKAGNITEYADSFSVSWSVILSAVNTFVLIYKIRDIFEFIECLECTTNKRKEHILQLYPNRHQQNDLFTNTHKHFLGLINPVSMAIYAKSNKQIEEYGNALSIFMRKVSIPCFIMPKFIISLVTYFTTDLGNDAFQLPFQLWWAHTESSKNNKCFIEIVVYVHSFHISF